MWPFLGEMFCDSHWTRVYMAAASRKVVVVPSGMPMPGDAYA